MNQEDKNTLNIFIQNQINNLPMLLNDELSYKNKKFNHRSDFFIIKEHIDDFLNGDNLNRYFVLPGLRGVGKTTMLYQTYEYLLKEKQIPLNQILYFSCETLNKLTKCGIFETVNQFVSEIHKSSLMTLNKELFILIDETHFDKNWSLTGKMIYDQSKKIFMIFTGSSAISLDFHADAARRMLRYEISPLSYSDYLNLKYRYNTYDIGVELSNLIFNGKTDEAKKSEHKINNDLLNLVEYNSQDWDNYFKYGGFPAVINDINYRIVQKKLLYSIDSVIGKDLKTLQNITPNNENNAYLLLKFLAQKVPGEISQHTLSNLISSSSSLSIFIK